MTAVASVFLLESSRTHFLGRPIFLYSIRYQLYGYGMQCSKWPFEKLVFFRDVGLIFILILPSIYNFMIVSSVPKLNLYIYI